MNYRNTKQKALILSIIDKYGHLTIEELKEYINKEEENISIATIYRNLTTLSQEGKIKKIYSNDKQMFETIKNEHYHFECTSCKKVVDIDPSFINININHSIAGIEKKELFLYGICNDCKNNID